MAETIQGGIYVKRAGKNFQVVDAEGKPRAGYTFDKVAGEVESPEARARAKEKAEAKAEAKARATAKAKAAAAAKAKAAATDPKA